MKGGNFLSQYVDTCTWWSLDFSASFLKGVHRCELPLEVFAGLPEPRHHCLRHRYSGMFPVSIPAEFYTYTELFFFPERA